MAQINITASELNVTRQKIQNKFVKIELLNSDFQTIDMLEGVCLNGSTSVDANSDMRRSATLKFVVIDSSFEVNSNSKIWLDKYIRIYIGTESIAENEIIYSKIGTFIIDAPTYEYDAVNNSVQLSCLDLMAKLSGLRDGFLTGASSYTIAAGENIRQAIIDTLALGGFTRQVCDEAPEPSVVPNDLVFSQGASYYTILAALRDIYPSYEIYFDVDGVFHYNHIPTGDNEPIQIDDALWENIVLSEKVEVNFQNVKNYIEVWGRTHDPAYFATSVSVNNNLIILTIPDVSNYVDGIIYGFTLSNSVVISNPKVKINNLAEKTLYNMDSTAMSTIPPVSTDTYYCIQYKDGEMYWVGHLQAYAIAKDDNPDSPYYVEGSIGQIELPLYGGEYENCMTDELAQERANYELYMRTNMENSITLSCIPVPWLDVNMLVEYTLQRNGETNLYLVKSFSYGFNITDTMSVTMIKYYPDYSYI